MLSGTEVTNPTSGFERLRGKQVSGFIDASKQIYFLLMIKNNDPWKILFNLFMSTKILRSHWANFSA